MGALRPVNDRNYNVCGRLRQRKRRYTFVYDRRKHRSGIMSISYCQNQVSGKFIQKTIFSTNDWEKNRTEMFFYFIIRSWDKRERKMLDWIILTLVHTVVARFSAHPHRVFLEIIPCLIINVKFGSEIQLKVQFHLSNNQKSEEYSYTCWVISLSLSLGSSSY